MANNRVVPKEPKLSEAQFHGHIIAGLARVAARIGRGTLADSMSRTTRALDKVFAGSTPDAHALFEATRADPTVLDEIAAAYGLRLVPMHSDRDSDLVVAAELCDCASEIIHANREGCRSHQDTIRIAEKLRPAMGPALAIIEEADELRSTH
jgi:hypothetical protein